MIKSRVLSVQNKQVCAIITGILLLAGMPTLQAQEFNDYKSENKGAKTDKQFIESDWTLPAAPKAEDLLRFYTSENQIFSLDPTSLIIATDGSVRYTMVTVSKSGAKNISYEGLRCATYEKKLVAFGRADGSWSQSRNKEWTPINNTGANKQHSVLAHDFMCDGNSTAGDAAKILQRIRSNRPLNPYSN